MVVEDPKIQEAQEMIRLSGSRRWLLVLMALFCEVSPSGRIRVRTNVWIVVGVIVLLTAFIGWHWGLHTLLLTLICAFWLSVIVLITSALRGEKRQRIAASGGPIREPFGRKLLRIFAGVLIGLIGFILLLTAAVPTVALQPKINPADTMWGNTLLFALFAIPGLCVMAIGAGLLCAENSSTGRTDWQTTSKKMYRFIRHTGYITAPFVFAGILFMFVMDRVRFRSPRPPVSDIPDNL